MVIMVWTSGPKPVIAGKAAARLVRHAGMAAAGVMWATAYVPPPGYMLVPSTTVAAQAATPLPWMGVWEAFKKIDLPIGIGVACWGLIEYLLGRTEGWERAKRAFLVYAGISAVPLMFLLLDETMGPVVGQMMQQYPSNP